MCSRSFCFPTHIPPPPSTNTEKPLFGTQGRRPAPETQEFRPLRTDSCFKKIHAAANPRKWLTSCQAPAPAVTESSPSYSASTTWLERSHKEGPPAARMSSPRAPLRSRTETAEGATWGGDGGYWEGAPQAAREAQRGPGKARVL